MAHSAETVQKKSVRLKITLVAIGSGLRLIPPTVTRTFPTDAELLTTFDF